MSTKNDNRKQHNGINEYQNQFNNNFNSKVINLTSDNRESLK